MHTHTYTHTNTHTHTHTHTHAHTTLLTDHPPQGAGILLPPGHRLHLPHSSNLLPLDHPLHLLLFKVRPCNTICTPYLLPSLPPSLHLSIHPSISTIPPSSLLPPSLPPFPSLPPSLPPFPSLPPSLSLSPSIPPPSCMPCRKLRHMTHSRMLVQLCLSLVLLWVVFLVAMHKAHGNFSDALCGIFSALLQYFMLVFFAWTACQAFFLCLKIVKVFYREPRFFYLELFAVAWGMLCLPHTLSLI